MAETSEVPTGARSDGALARGGDAVSTHDQREPWARFAWVLGAVWVVFMLFPISAAWEAAVSEPQRLIATGLLIVYALTYIVVYMWMIRSESWAIASRRGYIGLAVMVALMAAAAVAIRRMSKRQRRHRWAPRPCAVRRVPVRPRTRRMVRQVYSAAVDRRS